MPGEGESVSGEAVGVIGRLIAELNKLPGIGPKTAERLTHHHSAIPTAGVAGPGLVESSRRVRGPSV